MEETENSQSLGDSVGYVRRKVISRVVTSSPLNQNQLSFHTQPQQQKNLMVSTIVKSQSKSPRRIPLIESPPNKQTPMIELKPVRSPIFEKFKEKAKAEKSLKIEKKPIEKDKSVSFKSSSKEQKQQKVETSPFQKSLIPAHNLKLSTKTERTKSTTQPQQTLKPRAQSGVNNSMQKSLKFSQTTNQTQRQQSQTQTSQTNQTKNEVEQVNTEYMQQLRTRLQTLINQNIQLDAKLNYILDDESRNLQENAIKFLQQEIASANQKIKMIQRQVKNTNDASQQMKVIDNENVVDSLEVKLSQVLNFVQNYEQEIKQKTTELTLLERKERSIQQILPSCYVQINKQKIEKLAQEMQKRQEAMIGKMAKTQRHTLVFEAKAQDLALMNEQFAQIKTHIKEQADAFQHRITGLQKLKQMRHEELMESMQDYEILTNELKQQLQKGQFQFE